MHIKIIAIGKLKEKYLKEGIEEYAKRLKNYCRLEIIELSDEKAPENLSDAQMAELKRKEGEKMLAKIKEDEFVYCLAIQGKMLSSEALAEEMSQLALHGKSNVTFVIGGSLGTSEEVNQRANSLISFGKITYPHQLIRLVLTEQIYRIFRIQTGAPYHK